MRNYSLKTNERRYRTLSIQLGAKSLELNWEYANLSRKLKMNKVREHRRLPSDARWMGNGKTSQRWTRELEHACGVDTAIRGIGHRTTMIAFFHRPMNFSYVLFLV